MGLYPLHENCILRCGSGLQQGFEFVAVALQVVAGGYG